MSLATLADVKLHLGITTSDDDTLLAELQAAAEVFIEAHCSRVFTGGTFTEDHPGGSRAVFVKNFPIVTVTTIHMDPNRVFGAETLLEADQYVIHKESGVIECLSGPFLPARSGTSEAYPATVRVVYTTSTSVPEPVARAYAELIGHWYRQAKTAGTLGQQNLLQETTSGTVRQYPWAQSGGFRLPGGMLQLLHPYRVPAL